MEIINHGGSKQNASFIMDINGWVEKQVDNPYSRAAMCSDWAETVRVS